MAETKIQWIVEADPTGKSLFENLIRSRNDEKLAENILNLLSWAKPDIMKESPLAVLFELIYNSNWEDAEHTIIDLSEDKKWITIESRCPEVFVHLGEK
jgi:hypothetical protein